MTVHTTDTDQGHPQTNSTSVAGERDAVTGGRHERDRQSPESESAGRTVERGFAVRERDTRSRR